MIHIAMAERIVPAINGEDDDDVIVALATARVSEERGDLESASKWLHRAAAAARRQGRPIRAGDLSRSAAQVVGAPGKFEKKPDEAHVLSDLSDDDFAEKTIVETAEQIANKDSREASSDVAPLTERVPPMSASPEGDVQTGPVVKQPTPIAPLVTQTRPSAHQALRVAVKKMLGGKFEARPLSEGESVGPGEHEALLVPVHGSSKLT